MADAGKNQGQRVPVYDPDGRLVGWQDSREGAAEKFGYPEDTAKKDGRPLGAGNDEKVSDTSVPGDLRRVEDAAEKIPVRPEEFK
jgi:hypothetical protein